MKTETTNFRFPNVLAKAKPPYRHGCFLQTKIAIEGSRKVQLVLSFNNAIMWDNIRINILPFHHLLGWCLVGYCGCFQEIALFCEIPFRGHRFVFVGGLMCHGGVICKIPPSIANKISWNLESCQLHPVAQVPRLYLSGKKNIKSHLQASLGGLPFSIDHRKSKILLPVSNLLCHVCSQLLPWVLSQIGPVSWLEGKSYIRLRTGRCLGENHQWPE